MYQEIKPSIELAHLIDTFWSFSNNNHFEKFKLFPDACTDLIFDLKKNQAFISGVMTKFQLRELTKDSELIGIRFKTENFGLLSKTPQSEIKNSRIELSEIFPNQNLNSLVQLTDFENGVDKIKTLENFVTLLFRENHQEKDKAVLEIARKIRMLKGNVVIKDLAKSSPLSLRQLERRFKNRTGLTLKEFSSIVRFKNAKREISTFSGKSLLEIAFDLGFFDHSHMNNEFKRISGENPLFFR